MTFWTFGILGVLLLGLFTWNSTNFAQLLHLCSSWDHYIFNAGTVTFNQNIFTSWNIKIIDLFPFSTGCFSPNCEVILAAVLHWSGHHQRHQRAKKTSRSKPQSSRLQVGVGISLRVQFRGALIRLWSKYFTLRRIISGGVLMLSWKGCNPTFRAKLNVQEFGSFCMILNHTNHDSTSFHIKLNPSTSVLTWGLQLTAEIAYLNGI